MKANNTLISRISNIWNSFFTIFLFFCILCLGFENKIQAKDIVILKSNNSSIILNANALDKENTVYKIYSNYSLNDKNVRVGKGSEIEFIDGSISNGVISLAKGCRLLGNKQDCQELKICITGEDVEINGLKTTSIGNTVIYSFSSCNSLKVLNCEINALKGNGIKIVADKIKGVVKGLCFSNNLISFNRMGIEIQNHGNKEYRYNGINIVNCRFSMNTSISKYGCGVSLSGYGRNVAISNCDFDAVSVGIEIVGFSDVDINSNHFDRISKKVIATSNKRPMSGISIKTNVANCDGAKLQFTNTRKIIIERNEFNISMIEMIGCSSCKIAKNRLTTNGHYAIMLDGGKQSTENNWVYDNDVFQQGDNWSVFRCYGVYSRGNRFDNNYVKRANKKGVAHDQMKGASNNMFK